MARQWEEPDICTPTARDSDPGSVYLLVAWLGFTWITFRSLSLLVPKMGGKSSF